MNKEAFIQPRFVGPRFEQATLPLSVAKDLAAYEELVVELAKHLFRKKHDDRERVPKGFCSDFSLHIEKIDDGSAKPALVAMLMGAQLINPIPIELHEARELINQVIATEVGQPLPAAFPKDFYSYFNRIGRSLEERERIEWAPNAPDNQAVLDPTKRKRLVLAHRETYEAAVEVMGRVEALDVKKKTGMLRKLDGAAVAFDYDDPFFSDLKKALGDSTLQVRILGFGVFDVNDRLDSIVEIDRLDAVAHYDLISRVESLATLENGWLEGRGIAPTWDHLAWLSNELSKAFPEGLGYPSVAPTEEGNVVLEWMKPHARIELEVNFHEKKLELYATNLKTGHFEEKVFGVAQWAAAFPAVEALLSA